jgi:hypothetical protein
MAKFKPGDKVKYCPRFLKSTGTMSDRGRRGVITDDPTGMPGGDFLSVKWNDESEPQPIKEMSLTKASTETVMTAAVRRDIYRTLVQQKQTELAKQFARQTASFKAAVPGNLADNTKPSTDQSQKHAVDLLKQGGILPETEDPSSYPVLTARVKRDVIVTLLKQRKPTLANWAARNLTISTVSTSFTPGDIWKHNRTKNLWFAPLAALKNGGVKGLEIDQNVRGGNKAKNASVPSNIFNWYDKVEPPEHIRAIFQDHPKFPG